MIAMHSYVILTWFNVHLKEKGQAQKKKYIDGTTVALEREW